MFFCAFVRLSFLKRGSCGGTRARLWRARDSSRLFRVSFARRGGGRIGVGGVKGAFLWMGLASRFIKAKDVG